MTTCMGNCFSPGCRLWCLWWCLFVLSFFPRGVLDKILSLIESVSEGFSFYSHKTIMKWFLLLAHFTYFFNCLLQRNICTRWSMVSYRFRNGRTGFVFWTRRFLRKMAEPRPLSQVRNIFAFVLLLFGEFKCCLLSYGRRYTSPLSSTAK